MNIRTMAHIWEQGVHKTAIFTEASKSEDGKTTGVYYVGGRNVEEKFRITSNNTIYTAELIAIRQAVRWIDATNVKDANIYNDSLMRSPVPQDRELEFQTTLDPGKSLKLRSWRREESIWSSTGFQVTWESYHIFTVILEQTSKH